MKGLFLNTSIVWCTRRRDDPGIHGLYVVTVLIIHVKDNSKLKVQKNTIQLMLQVFTSLTLNHTVNIKTIEMCSTFDVISRVMY